MYERGIKKKRSVTKSKEILDSVVITPEVGGNILSSVLLKSKDHADHIYAELQQCGIEPPMPIEDMMWKEVIDLLWMDEYHLLAQQELARSI